MNTVELEHLQEIGSFGLACDIEFSILEIDYGDGYDDSSLVGSSLGTRSWKLVYKVLPGTKDGALSVNEVRPHVKSSICGSFLRRACGGTDFYNVLPRVEKSIGKFVEHRSLSSCCTKLFHCFYHAAFSFNPKLILLSPSLSKITKIYH
jgi:hypothetical protein